MNNCLSGLETPAVQQKISEFCHFHHIQKLSLFGSILRQDFGPDSDVDFLVEFEPAHIPGLLKIAAMEQELSQIVGRKADLRTPNDLSRYFRQEVMEEAVPQYVEAG